MADTTRVEIQTPDGPIVVAWKASATPDITAPAGAAALLAEIDAEAAPVAVAVDEPEGDHGMALDAAFAAGLALGLRAARGEI